MLPWLKRFLNNPQPSVAAGSYGVVEEADLPEPVTPIPYKDLFCSFCGDPSFSKETLLAAPDATICDECVSRANERLAAVFWTRNYERWKQYGP
jgi:ClpX C4-type zinc finger